MKWLSGFSSIGNNGGSAQSRGLFPGLIFVFPLGRFQASVALVYFINGYATLFCLYHDYISSSAAARKKEDEMLGN
jgi:hypothetical protein